MKLCSIIFIITVLIGNALSHEPFGLDNHYNWNSQIGESMLNDIDLNGSILSKIFAYKRFFDEMVQNDGMYSIAGTILGYQVNQLNNNMVSSNELDHIIENLIPEIKQLPWNRTITLHSSKGKYLCSSEEQNATKPAYHRVIFLQNLDYHCYWSLNVEANGRYFTLKNKASKRYLFAADNSFDLDDKQRRIFTVADVSRIVDKSDKWQLEPVRNGVMEYRIKNLCWDEYIYKLYESDLFSWKPSGCEKDNCRWKIETAPNQLPIERQNFLTEYYNGYHGKDNIANLLMKHAVNSSTQTLEYRNLYDLMKHHNGLYSITAMTLDYNVYKVMQEKSADPNLAYIEQNLRKQWTKFPWNNRILIQNEYYKQFLCSSDHRFKNTTFTVGYTGTLSDNSSCHWKIEADSDDQGFRFKNLANGKYLFAAPNQYSFDALRRRVFVANSHDWNNYMSVWQFQHERKSDHVVRIKNVYWHEYLHILFNGKMDRDLMTWRPFGCDRNRCLWRIIDADAS